MRPSIYLALALFGGGRAHGRHMNAPPQPIASAELARVRR
jgi:hypothetical protein